jgi:hypothetical protein
MQNKLDRRKFPLIPTCLYKKNWRINKFNSRILISIRRFARRLSNTENSISDGKQIINKNA